MGSATLERNAVSAPMFFQIASFAAATSGRMAAVRPVAFARRVLGAGTVLVAVCHLAPLAGALVAAEPRPAGEDRRPTVIMVAGAAGATEFQSDLNQQTESWAKVSETAGASYIQIGTGAPGETTDYVRLKQALEAEPKEGVDEIWLVLAGHGTFDGTEAKLNLRGPDVSATELAEWLKPFQRPIAIIDTTSASAPFLARLAAPGRVIITSTRSGYEQNYSRFGKFLAEALPDMKSDLDKDGQISLLEAFLSASHRTAEFYKSEGRLATEHSLIDDNGDGLGTPSDWFRGVRAVRKAEDNAPLDGIRAHQFHLVFSEAEQQLAAEVRARRDAIELELEALRDRKSAMSEDAYYLELEARLLKLAALYDGN